eukprot:12420860-Karenia_brevis.AAC.1
MRALLAVEHHRTGVTWVTLWSDRRNVLDGYQKGRATSQSVLCIDWEDFWNRVDALAERNIEVRLKKVKAYTSDTNIAATEQQAGNWLAD